MNMLHEYDIHEFHNKQETKRVFSSEFTFETKFESKLFLITKEIELQLFCSQKKRNKKTNSSYKK